MKLTIQAKPNSKVAKIEKADEATYRVFVPVLRFISCNILIIEICK